MSAKTWVEAEWADSLDEELEMEIDDNLVAKDLAFISEKKHKSSLDRNTYFHELLRLQAELVKLAGLGPAHWRKDRHRF